MTQEWKPEKLKSLAWSYSRLKSYETCPLQYLHYHVEKDVQERDQHNQQSNDGLEAHKAYELRLKEGKKLPLGLIHHEPILAKLEALPGEKHTEQKLALTDKFRPTGFFARNVWFRTVIDFCVIKGGIAGVVDYKTGKPTPDETQLQLMSLTIMHYDQNVQKVNARLLFMNHDQVEKATYQRADMPKIWSEILPRVKRMQNDQDFIPKPSGLCIRHCAVTECTFHGRGSRA